MKKIFLLIALILGLFAAGSDAEITQQSDLGDSSIYGDLIPFHPSEVRLVRTDVLDQTTADVLDKITLLEMKVTKLEAEIKELKRVKEKVFNDVWLP